MSVNLKDSLKIDTLSLLSAYRKTLNPLYRNQILELNVGLARKEAYHWSRQGRENYEDLLQIGCLGLLRAIERFNLDKGHAFSSFAIPYIRGEIQHYLRDKSHSVRIPRRWIEMGFQSAAIKRDFQTKFNRQPTDIEIAYLLEISSREWQEVKLALQNREPLSLDASVNNDDGNQVSLMDTVADPHYRSFQLSHEDQLRLQQALTQLEDRTRQILEFVFLRDLTQRETAEQLGISVVTVSRRVKKGLESLKIAMS
jgi:RNA polymerase sigma-B factor